MERAIKVVAHPARGARRYLNGIQLTNKMAATPIVKKRIARPIRMTAMIERIMSPQVDGVAKDPSPLFSFVKPSAFYAIGSWHDGNMCQICLTHDLGNYFPVTD